MKKVFLFLLSALCILAACEPIDTGSSQFLARLAIGNETNTAPQANNIIVANRDSENGTDTKVAVMDLWIYATREFRIVEINTDKAVFAADKPFEFEESDLSAIHLSLIHI